MGSAAWVEQQQQLTGEGGASDMDGTGWNGYGGAKVNFWVSIAPHPPPNTAPACTLLDYCVLLGAVARKIF